MEAILMQKFLVIWIASLSVVLASEDTFSVKSLQELRNSEVIRQEFEESCGAASLATLINFFELRKIGEREVLEILEQKTDMLSFRELQLAGGKLGYQMRGYQISREILEKTNYPLLVKIQDDPRFPHFVVVINYKGDFLRIFDPNFGSYISSKSEFYSIWDSASEGGYALILITQRVPYIPALNLPPKLFFERKY